MSDYNIGFIGFGLIGGSIAKGLRRSGRDFTITAYNRSKEARELALQSNTAHFVTSSIDEHFSNCDFIFLCTPVAYNIEHLKKLKSIIKSDCIITDVGSVKTTIHDAVISEDMEANFIGGHPMAGSEKAGFSHSTAHLCENAFYVITPTSATNPKKLEALKELVLLLGAIPVIMDYKEHDYVTAAISHLPHLIAASLVNLVKHADSEKEYMKQIAAGGFKDITRIASSSPTMWEQICTENKFHISALLEKYIAALVSVKADIDAADNQALYDLFEQSRSYRSTFSNISAGPIKKVSAIYCDIIDEAGAISSIALILAKHCISIKNIGIIHNRDFEEGVLKIEFYNDDIAEKAIDLLKKYDYTICDKKI